MKQSSPPPSASSTPTARPATPAPLERAHLIELEPVLCRALSRLLPFTSHSLYFPTTAAPDSPQWIARERTLLLPLVYEGSLLGVFMARGVDGRLVRRLLPQLPAVVALCLDNLALTRQSRIDHLTGLALPHVLLERMRLDTEAVRARFVHADGADDGAAGTAPLHRACAGLVVIRWHGMRRLAAETGYAFTDALTRLLAEELTSALPGEALAARTGDDEFTLLLPAATRSACRKLVDTVLARLDEASLRHPVTHRAVRPRCFVGYALYPQDMDAEHLPLPMQEQSRVLLHKARLAATVAQERGDASRSMAYGRILAEGGVIREAQPLGRVLTSLGRQMGATEGLRFSVWSRGEQPACKGEVVLLDVRDASSAAETLHLADPAAPLEPGDALLLLAPSAPLADATGNAPADTGTGLLRHGDFLRRLAEETASRAVFTLTLLRVAPTENTENDPVALLADAFASSAARTGLTPLASGRYGENSLAFLLPCKEAPLELLTALCAHAAQTGLDVAVGTASYPCLRFRKGEMLECCRKALELALLLPRPRVGEFGSLALNISADKRYAQGDVFGAVEEYQMALLADAGNSLAWNSLGVCMAALARHHEARRYFLEALKHKPDDPATLYNLGNVCQSLGETRAAARHYRHCIRCNPQHYFAHIRLGQLAESGGRHKLAKDCYTIAAQLEDAPLPSAPSAQEEAGITPAHHTVAAGGRGLARRHLARVALHRRKQSEARELLHEALLRNPQDAVAMEMLANLYLDSHEDPAVAEMLARKCVGLRPGHRPARQLLARALRALGRNAEAASVEASALDA